MNQTHHIAPSNDQDAPAKQRKPRQRAQPIGQTDLLDATEAAAHLGYSASTLGYWRHKKTGPAYLRRISRIYYKRSDLDAFLKFSTVYKRGAM